jgi:hypothetical protein
VGLAGIALHVVGCLGTGPCDSLRARLLDERDSWSVCDPSQGDDQCAIVTGDGTDCTGVFRCDFPVNRGALALAERAVVAVASQSPECAAVCSGLTCPADAPPRCDPLTRHCVMDAFSEGGAPPPNGLDAALPPIETPDAYGGDQ